MKRNSKSTARPKRKHGTEGFLEEYLADFATQAPDLLAPELQAFNTRRLNDLWKVSCDRADAMTPVPFWGIVWPGSRALARYILDNREKFHGRRILDVGTGSGLAAIAAASVGARVTGIDIDPMSVELAAHTAKINGVENECDWLIGDILKLPEATLAQYELILAGDVFYEEKFARQAIDFLRNAREYNLDNLLADPGRTHRPRTDATGQNEYRVKTLAEYRVPVYVDIEGIKERTTTLLSIL